MADNLQHEVLFKYLLVHPIMRLKNNLLIYKLYFLGKKKSFKTRRLLHRLYSSINSSERKHMFLVNIQSYWGLEILQEINNLKIDQVYLLY